MDLFFIDYKGQKIEVTKAQNAEAYLVHFHSGDKTIVPYQAAGKSGWRFENEEISTEAQEVGALIEKSFIIRMSDSDFKTLDEYFNETPPEKE